MNLMTLIIKRDSRTTFEVRARNSAKPILSEVQLGRALECANKLKTEFGHEIEVKL